MGDNELGLFLRTRRDALTPGEVGLPAGPRRRASGLRRSEVAALAGVSVEYVTKLEQGQDRRPSTQVLSALADALRLGLGARAHLYRLTKAADSHYNCLGRSAPSRSVREPVRAILERLEPTPAVLLNRLGDVLAHTGGFEGLMRPTGLLDEERPNVPRFVLADPRARDVFPEWDAVADEQVARLKNGPFRADPHIAALADELALVAGEDFTRRVETVPGFPRGTGVVSLGSLRVRYETLDLPAEDDQRLVVLLV